MMTNDTSTYVGAKQEAIDRLENNLAAMGVTASYDRSQGYYVLLDEILNIEPSIGGLDLDTAISLTASETTVTYGESIVLTSKLTASYDDETLVNVDLHGVLTGATVQFKQGNTVLATSVTGSDGICTATITPETSGNIKAVFAGTDNFNDCESSNVAITVNGYLDLTSDKDILSYNDHEYATLTATLHSADNSGKTIVYEVNKDIEGAVHTMVIDEDISNDVLLSGEITDIEFADNYEGAITIATTDENNPVYASISIDNSLLTAFVYGNGVNYTISDVGESLSISSLKEKLHQTFGYSLTQQFKVLSTSFNADSNNITVIYDDSLIETLYGTTNAVGVATVSYFGKDTGDINIKANHHMILSETYEICDARWHNNGSSINGLSSQNGVSTTSDGEWITITTNTSGEKYVLTPISFDGNDNWEFSCKCKTSSFNSQALGWQLANENSYTLFDNRYFAVASANSIYSRLGGSGQSFDISISDNDIVRVQRVDGYWKIYVNDTLVQSVSHTWSGNKTISFYTNQNRVQHLKELVIKQL